MWQSVSEVSLPSPSPRHTMGMLLSTLHTPFHTLPRPGHDCGSGVGHPHIFDTPHDSAGKNKNTACWVQCCLPSAFPGPWTTLDIHSFNTWLRHGEAFCQPPFPSAMLSWVQRQPKSMCWKGVSLGTNHLSLGTMYSRPCPFHSHFCPHYTLAPLQGCPVVD